VDADANAGEFPAFRAKCTKEIAASLSQDRSHRACVGSKLELAAPGIGDMDPRRKGARQASPNDERQCLLAAAPRFPFAESCVCSDDSFERLHGGH